MPNPLRLAALAALAPALTGCVSMAKTVVTAPFKIGSAVVDATTTSQSEADRNRGRAIRKQEERDARDARRRAKQERGD